MAQGNVDIVRRFSELMQRDGWEELDLLAEDVVYRPISEITEAGEFRGRDGYRRYFQEHGFTDRREALEVAARA